jgi:membrane protein implicated in regulation of membrane protease activity
MIETISVFYLLSIGVIFIGLEALTFSFFMFFIGLGFILVAAISYFYTFENGIIQIAISFIIAVILIFAFRNTLLSKISKKSKTIEQKTHKSGIGYIEDGMVKFHGTYWKTLDDISSYKNGDNVKIIDIKDNIVILDKNT